ncbi:MAG TPA: hypothetical protein VKA84_17935 [Gemmatimonadaceae bacterium]|nr:hypothetical protein [Gemmatimonadaceae bacterium]
MHRTEQIESLPESQSQQQQQPTPEQDAAVKGGIIIIGGSVETAVNAGTLLPAAQQVTQPGWFRRA